MWDPIATSARAPVAIAIGSTFLCYLIVAVHHKSRSPPPKPRGTIVFQLVRPFATAGYASVAQRAQTIVVLDRYANDPHKEGDDTSPVMLYEEDQVLGPGKGSYADIHNHGAGRFAHWKGVGIVFSSSDNSDPNTNNRRYWAVVP